MKHVETFQHDQKHIWTIKSATCTLKQMTSWKQETRKAAWCQTELSTPYTPTLIFWKWEIFSAFHIFSISPTSKVYGEEQGSNEFEDVKHCCLWLLGSGITLYNTPLNASLLQWSNETYTHPFTQTEYINICLFFVCFFFVVNMFCYL